MKPAVVMICRRLNRSGFWGADVLPHGRRLRGRKGSGWGSGGAIGQQNDEEESEESGEGEEPEPSVDELLGRLADPDSDR